MKTVISLLAGMVLMTTAALADSAPIGYVKTVTGDAFVVTEGTEAVARPGTPIHVGDLLKTGSPGSLGITFQDNTVMSFGEDTELTVDEYLYQPRDNQLSFVSNMSKGTLQFVSGVIAKLEPEKVAIKTPAGTVGVRGTRFLLKVED